jgi:hypothetical protein
MLLVRPRLFLLLALTRSLSLPALPISYPSHIPFPLSAWPLTGLTAAPSFGAIGTVGGGAKKTGPPNACLFIYHIPITWSDQDLAQCFAPFAPPGNLLNAMVYKDRSTGASKGFGFIDYDNPISAQNAINAMHGMSVDGKRLRVEIKKAKGATPY